MNKGDRIVINLRTCTCVTVIAISALGLRNLIAGPKLAPVDGQPAMFSISMPDYHRTNREIWVDETNAVWLKLQSVAEDAIKSVGDDRLAIDQRSAALSIVEQFSANLTANRLIENIDLEDNRYIHFSGVPRGRYPVVTVLEEYGEPVVPYINVALSKEDSPAKRRLLCDVLVKSIGPQRANQLLTKFLADSELTEEQTRRLRFAIEDLAARNEDSKTQ